MARHRDVAALTEEKSKRAAAGQPTMAISRHDSRLTIQFAGQMARALLHVKEQLMEQRAHHLLRSRRNDAEAAASATSQISSKITSSGTAPVGSGEFVSRASRLRRRLRPALARRPSAAPLRRKGPDPRR